MNLNETHLYFTFNFVVQSFSTKTKNTKKKYKLDVSSNVKESLYLVKCAGPKCRI